MILERKLQEIVTKNEACFWRGAEKEIQNPNKVRLQLKEVSYIGHLLTAEGLKVDPAKVRAIQVLPRPKDAKIFWEWQTAWLAD